LNKKRSKCKWKYYWYCTKLPKICPFCHSFTLRWFISFHVCCRIA